MNARLGVDGHTRTAVSVTDRIGSRAADELVRTSATEQGIVTRAADDDVV
ncbi:hypothetical protein [Pseudomonas sp. Root401]|nr:hypothetical protein [Pseudomonas sp. Root401]